MKKILAIILSTLLLVTPLSINVFAEGNKAEIEFSVGDDTLIINGNPVQVEKPYVVGVGVTLVPIRVITEAFGAKVDWEGETKTVKVDYPGVNIVLRIGDITAEVNGRAETLLAAPELTANGYTMIPLRFISENFGADVSYDNETARIKVTLSDTQSGTTVSETIKNKYVGDSYYGWSMENLSDFYISDRDFDGTYTCFDYDDYNWFNITIAARYEDYDFDKDFAETKDYLRGYTLVKADKDTSNYNKKSYRIQARDKAEFIDIKTILTDKYIVMLFGNFENDKTDIKNEYLSKADTFDMVYEAEDIYDLSNVKDGYRRFTAENLNISFDVFANLMLLSGKEAENEFAFGNGSGDDIYSGIDFVVYSKDSVGGAEQLARNDHDRNKEEVNEIVATYDDVKKSSYKNFSAYEYSYTLKAAFFSRWDRDVFFEKGDYVYNIHISFKLPKDNKEALADRILNSVELSEIDANKVGKLLRNVNDYKGTTYTSTKIKNCTITVPKSYTEIPNSNGGNQQISSAVNYVNGENGIVIAAGYITRDEGFTTMKMREIARENENEQKENDAESVVMLVSTEINKNKAYMYTVSVDDKENKVRVYNENYCIMNPNNNSIYVFSVIYPELIYSAKTRKEVREILDSIVFK